MRSLLTSLLIGLAMILLLSSIKLDEALAATSVEASYCPSLIFRRVAEAATMLWMIAIVVNYAVLSRRNKHLTAISVESSIIGSVSHYAWLLGIGSCIGSVKTYIEVTILPLIYFIKIGEGYSTAFLDIGQLMILYSIVELVRGIVPRTVLRTRRTHVRARTVS